MSERSIIDVRGKKTEGIPDGIYDSLRVTFLTCTLT